MILNPTFRTLSTMELLRSVETVRSEWKYKSPLQMFSYLYSIGKAVFQLACIPLYADDQRLHWFSYFPFVYIGLDTILVIYTIYYCVINGEFSKCFACTCILSGPIVSCLPMIFELLSEKRAIFHSLVNFPGRYILRHDCEDPEYNRICKEQLNVNIRAFTVKYVLMALGGVCAEIGPTYYYMNRGVRTTTTNVMIPLTHENSDAVFLWNVFLQVVIYFHGALLFIGVEIAMSIFGNVARLVPKLVQYELMQLIDKHERNEISDTQLRVAFRNVVIQCVDFLSFMGEVKSFLYWRNFMIPPLFIYAIAMSIYCQYSMDFGAGYGLAFMSYVQFFFVCEVAEYIEDNRFNELLYDTDWYKLPISLQKDVLFLMHRLQTGTKLTIGPFRVINRQLFNVATNKMYSFIMFLLNFGN